ncbi:MAG: hypothetical protein RLZZ15_2294 [Verrucomicrobiota bacterium]
MKPLPSRLIAAAFLATASAGLLAQTAAPAPVAGSAKDTVQLSAFEVRTDKDRGYQAIDAGSGGRVDLPFALVPSAMSAITKEFLEDWAVTDMRDALRYAGNVDIANNSAVNTSPFGDFQFNFRGVGDTGNYPTRNYFLYYGNSDSYNTERFEFARGPNSVLFGDGQIGGLATTTTKRPLARDLNQLTARYDNWGGFRGTFDANRVLSDRQSIRVNGLYSRNAYGPAYRDNAISDDKAIDLTWGYKLTKTTTFRAETEWSRLKRMTFATTYADNMGYYTPGTTVDGTATPPATSPPPTAAQQAALGITPVSGNAFNYTFIPAEAGLGLINTGGNFQFRSTGPGFSLRTEGRSDLPGLATNAKLPSREFNLAPNDSLARFKFQIYSFYLDQKITDDISAQVSFYDYNNDRNSRETAFASTLQFDVNRFLPNGAANPKLGVAYAEMSPARQYQENYVYEWRGMLTWRPRLPFNGRGQFSGIIGQRNERFEARSLITARVDGPNQIWTAAENTLRYRYYVDEPGKYGGAELPADRPGFTYRFVPNGFHSVEHKDIQYIQAVAAASFLNDRISLLFGARNDDLVDDQYGNIAASAAGTTPALDSHGLQRSGGFVPGIGTVVGAHNLTKAGAFTTNGGTVVWLDKAKTVGTFFNYSKNFAPPTSGAAKIVGFNSDGTVNGTAFGATTGDSKEYGLKFSFLGGAITLEARRYDSTQIDRIDQGAPTGNIGAVWLNAGNAYNSNPALTALTYRDVGALKAKGYEFFAVGNYKGLSVSTNYSLPQTASLNVRPGTLAYANNFIPVWQKWATDGRNDKGDILTNAEINNINSNVLAIQNNIAGSAPGTVNNGTNKWVGSLAANYRFSRETKFDGFSFGWAISGRGPRKVGSVNPNILFNLANGATAKPEQNAAAAFAYTYAPTYFTQDANLAYRRRIGKYNARFQINISNLTDKQDRIFNTYATYRVLGQGANPLLGMFPTTYTWLDPRKIIFSTALDF